MSNYKAIIYDLDNTIFPADTITMAVAQPLLDAIRKDSGNILSPQLLEEAIADCYKISIRDVAKKYCFSQHMLKEALKAFTTMQIDYQLHPYSDYNFIRQIPGIRFLVTSGNTYFQNLKISNLGIKSDFQEIYIHDDEDSSFEGKLKIFQSIRNKYHLTNQRVMVVGDNPSSEIAAGNKLKMTTVQILREGVLKSDSANFHISSFMELKHLK